MQKMVSTISSFGDLSKLQYHLTKLYYFPEKMRGTRGGGTMRGTLEGRNNERDTGGGGIMIKDGKTSIIQHLKV